LIVAQAHRTLDFFKLEKNKLSVDWKGTPFLILTDSSFNSYKTLELQIDDEFKKKLRH
jgi:hypothetical protein